MTDRLERRSSGPATWRVNSGSRDLKTWATSQQRPDVISLSLYVNACTEPTDRVLVESTCRRCCDRPARVCGRHADLGPGFFESEDAQKLTLERLRRQSVPIILLDTDDSLRSFYRSFPDCHRPYRSGISSGRHAHI
jgi:hypothetical protein